MPPLLPLYSTVVPFAAYLETTPSHLSPMFSIMFQKFPTGAALQAVAVAHALAVVAEEVRSPASSGKGAETNFDEATTAPTKARLRVPRMPRLISEMSGVSQCAAGSGALLSGKSCSSDSTLVVESVKESPQPASVGDEVGKEKAAAYFNQRQIP